MKSPSAVFDLHKDIVTDYTSFINIADDEIRTAIEKEINEGRFWPEPLIQFNPSFEIDGTIASFCAQGKLLHEDIANAIGTIDLFKHQTKALELVVWDGKDFIVTSGTGSGKSHTYIATIFNYLLLHKQDKGIKAIIVYPMNALINSQKDSLDAYKENYEKTTGRQFPITYAHYTGRRY